MEIFPSLYRDALDPDTGKIEIFGHDVQKEEMLVKRLINRVSVEAASFKKLSALESLLYTAQLLVREFTTRSASCWSGSK